MACWGKIRTACRRLCLLKPRLGKALDIIRFLCKDVWMSLFGKSVDKLQTNHNGVFVLQDACHPPLLLLSAPDGDTGVRSLPYMLFYCGLLQGVLGAFGCPASVHAEVRGTRCVYQVRMTAVGGDAPAAPGKGSGGKVSAAEASAKQG